MKTDVDINYQHFIIFWFQTVLNGILMVCFTTRSFAKKILSTMYHRRRRRIEKKKSIDYFATQCWKIIRMLHYFKIIFFIINCRTLKVIQKIRFCPFAQLFLNNFDHLERPFCSISDTVNIQPINSYAAKTWWWQVFSLKWTTFSSWQFIWFLKNSFWQLFCTMIQDSPGVYFLRGHYSGIEPV